MARQVIEAIKRTLPAHRWRAIRRASNRLRWPLKIRLMRHYGFPIAQRPLVALKYVLWDPEVESYSYPIANADELAAFLAPILQVDRAQVAQWLDEARTDPILTRDRGFHWSTKRRQPLGNRTLWYPVIRALKPKLVVEAGVHEGLGSEMILVALKRNAAEGHPGKLISFDIHEDTGWLVSAGLREYWEFVLESTITGMPRVLAGREVDVFIHETPHTDETINHEVGVAMRHAGPRGLFVIDTSGETNGALRKLSRGYGVESPFFMDIPDRHIVRSNGTNVAYFDRATLDRGPENADAPRGAEDPHRAPGAGADVASAVTAKVLVGVAAVWDTICSTCELALPIV